MGEMMDANLEKADDAARAKVAKRKTVKQVDAEQNADSARIDALEKQVAQLRDMVVFLPENPQYKVRDYMAEKGIDYVG